MGPVRASNLERRRWRDLCREELAQHIGETEPLKRLTNLRDTDLHTATRLNIMVEPSEVRLKPGSDDTYHWKTVPGKEHLLDHLFSKNISEHSVGAYKELYAGVGRVFEAVAPPDETARTTQRLTGLGCLRPAMATGVDISFSAQIECLEEENARLSTEIEDTKRQLSEESRRRQEAEATLEQLGQANQRVREQHDKASLAAETYMRALEKQSQGLSVVMPILEELKRGLPNELVMSSAGMD